MVFNMKKIAVLAAFAALTWSIPAFAQELPTETAALDAIQIPSDLSGYDTGVNSEDISATVTPENPGAYQPVGISLDSDLVDLRRYLISWYVNGKLALEGYGKMNFVGSTAGYGQQVSIRVNIQLADRTIKKDVVLMPQDISTMWEAADSYVPPFYQGKKLPGREGVVRIVAIPNFQNGGRSVDPSTLVYNWKRNDNVLTGASAYGQDSIMIKNNKLRPVETFEVTASTPDNASQATSKTTLSFIDPKISFYQRNVENGITSPYAKNTILLTEPSTTVVAQPFFFSLAGPGRINSLDLKWKMNDQGISLPDALNQNVITLQNPGGNGTSSLALSISNPNTDFQSAVRRLEVIFAKK